MVDLEEFVNGNAHNVTMEEPDPDDAMEAFTEGLLVPHNEESDELCPVTVYLMDGVPVAWYDYENGFGYVVPQDGA